MQPEDRQQQPEHMAAPSRGSLLLRSIAPLILVVLALLACPTLLVWWLLGGPFGMHHAVIGGVISLLLLLLIGMAFGWAIGSVARGPKNDR